MILAFTVIAQTHLWADCKLGELYEDRAPPPSEYLTKATGENFVLRVPGLKKPLQGFFQIERETRLIIPGKSSIEINNPRRTFKAPVTYSDWRTLVDTLIYETAAESFSWSSNWERAPKALPLAHEHDVYHRVPDWVVEERSAQGSWEHQTDPLTQRIIIKHEHIHQTDMEDTRHFSPGDITRLSYLVSRRYERSLYFDGPTSQLAEKGIAVRLKEWYPAKLGEKSKPIARTLFVKVIMAKDGYIQFRQEWQLPLYQNYSFRTIRKIARALLQLATNEDVQLQPSVWLENTRTGLKLEADDGSGYFGPGFIALDKFRARKVDEVGNPYGKTFRPIYQIEVEIFPEDRSIKYLNQNRQQYDALIDHLSLITGGSKVIHEPKFKTALRKLR